MGAGAVVENNLFESDHQAAGIASLANLMEGIEPTQDGLLKEAFPFYPLPIPVTAST
jgi:hypothetical protein